MFLKIKKTIFKKSFINLFAWRFILWYYDHVLYSNKDSLAMEKITKIFVWSLLFLIINSSTSLASNLWDNSQITSAIWSKTVGNPYKWKLENNVLKKWEKIIDLISSKKEKYSEKKYHLLLKKYKYKLEKYNKKIINNPRLKNLLQYLSFEVNNLILIEKSAKKNKNAPSEIGREYRNIYSSDLNIKTSWNYTYYSKLVEPYTETLDFWSKYSDWSWDKSDIDEDKLHEIERKRENITALKQLIIKNSDYFIETQDEKYLSDIHLNIENWAKHNAMLGEATTSNGKAERKWFLSTLANVLLKLEASSEYQIHPHTFKWITDLSNKVYTDYLPRYPDHKYFNNHDLWAANALATSSIITQNSTHFNFSKNILIESLKRLTVDGEYAYWVVEAWRWNLGVNYTDYALNAFTHTAEVLYKNWYNVYTLNRYKKLVNFWTDMHLNFALVEKYFNIEQKDIDQTRLIWTYLYHLRTWEEKIESLAKLSRQYYWQVWWSIKNLMK